MSSVDKNKVRAAFDRAAENYDATANFQRRICERLAQLLPVNLHPASILDGGCGTGYGAELLHRRWPKTALIGCDLAPEMVRQTIARGIAATCGDLEHLPFPDAQFDLAWSSLALQWCVPERAYAELHRVLSPGGLLAMTTLGIGTLHELSTAFAGIDGHERVLDFDAEPRLRASLAASGFAEITILHETWVTHHADFGELLTTIRGIGAGQSGRNRRRSLMGKDAWQTAQSRYEALRNEDGMLPVTYKVFFVLSRKAA